VTTLLCGLGVWRLTMLPVDAFPDTTPVQVQINTVAPALNPEEIEQQITLPIELSIGGLPGLINVRSTSKFGFSQVVATFDDSTDIVDARQYVFERINAVELPEGIERPQLGPIATGLGEIFHYVVRSRDPNRTLEELRTIHDWVVKPELRKVPGVAEVNAWGGEVKQYHVVVDPEGLLKFDLTMDDVFEAIERNNTNVGGGLITSGGVSQMVHGIGRVTNIQQIENVVVASFGGDAVHVHDIARAVKVDHEIRRGAVTADGRGEVVLGLAFMLMGENGKIVTENLKAQLEQVRSALPDDVIGEVDVEGLAGGDEAAGDGNISSTRRDIAARMVVDRDGRGRAAAQGVAEEHPRPGIGAVDVALADLDRFADQLATGIQAEAPQAFVIAAGQRQHDLGHGFGIAKGGLGPATAQHPAMQLQRCTQALGPGRCQLQGVLQVGQVVAGESADGLGFLRPYPLTTAGAAYAPRSNNDTAG